MVGILRPLGLASGFITSWSGTSKFSADDEQKLLVPEPISDINSLTGTLPIKVQQNESICDAGSAHWTGYVPLGTGRDMFYCNTAVLFQP